VFRICEADDLRYTAFEVFGIVFRYLQQTLQMYSNRLLKSVIRSVLFYGFYRAQDEPLLKTHLDFSADIEEVYDQWCASVIAS